MAFLRPLLLAACAQLLLAVRDDEVRQQQVVSVHTSGAVVRERHHQHGSDGGADKPGPPPEKAEDDDDSDDFAVGNYEDKNATADGNAAAVSADIVVTTWNVGQLPQSRNPFAFWFEEGKPLFLEAERTRRSNTTVQAFLMDAFKSGNPPTKDDKLAALRATIFDPTKWEASEEVVDKTGKISRKGFISGGATKPTVAEITELWKTLGDMKLSEFFSTKNLGKDDDKGGYTSQFVADAIPWRFSNLFFVCAGGVAPVRGEGFFTVKAVMKVLVFDAIMEGIRLKANLPKLEDARVPICSRSSADAGHLKSIATVVKQADSSVLFLQEVPKAWTTTMLQQALNEGTDKKWLVLVQNPATQYGYLATAMRLDKFDGDSAVVQNQDSLTGTLSVSVSPANFSNDNITLINMRLPSDKPLQLKGMAKLLDSNWTLDQATIAGGDTQGEPRQATFEKLKFFVDEGFVNKEIYRATSAPWGKNPDVPAYGSVNVRRSGFELANAGKIDRMLQDNIYYTTTETIRVTQKDLCSGDNCMKRYTFDKKLQCFGGPSQDDRNITAAEKAAGATTGPKGKSYPRTCGYVGQRPTTYLPDLSQPFGISSHSPISARFLIEQTQAEAIARRGGSPRSSLPACFLLVACLALASRWL